MEVVFGHWDSWEDDSIVFFTSRRRHTRFDCDWSSDVCSSDLLAPISVRAQTRRSLAEKAQTAIARALGVPAPQGMSHARRPSRKGPGTSVDPPGEPH